MQAFWCKLPPFGVTLMMKNKAPQSRGDRVCLGLFLHSGMGSGGAGGRCTGMINTEAGRHIATLARNQQGHLCLCHQHSGI